MKVSSWLVLTAGLVGCGDATKVGADVLSASATADVMLDGEVVLEHDTTGTEPDTPPEYLAIAKPVDGELIAIEPGGDSICARGDAYRFFVYGGDPKKVVLDFQGGGACWNELTCSIGDAIFSDSTGDLQNIQADIDAGRTTGIYDFDNPDNPFYGWTLIHVPYCTGDIHWGDATVEYNDDLIIHHRGYRNTMAVVEWMRIHYPALEMIVTAGCSAGAYGAIGHAPLISDIYTEAEVRVIADSGCGIITDSFLGDSFPQWNARENMTQHLPSLAGRPTETLTLGDAYTAIGEAYPHIRISQVTTAYDKDQIFYYSVMGGGELDWFDAASSSLTAIRAATPTFRYYMAPGPVHCVHPYDLTNTRTVNGVRYADWVRSFISDETLPDDVICEGECTDDPVCAACALDSQSSNACRWCDGWAP